MAIITAESTFNFKSAQSLYGKVKRFLSDYNATNLIDEGEFPTYIKEVLRLLGIGVYEEQDAIVKVKNFKAPLPEHFTFLYAAYKCTPSFDSKTTIQPQGGARVFHDVTWELLGGNACEFDCQCGDNKILESITVRQFVQESPITRSFANPILLSLSPNVKKTKCTDDCQNLLASCPFEITIDDGHIYTNFTNDSIYLKYWGLSVDENGVPQIPDIEKVEKALEWYIIFQVALKWMFNKKIADVRGLVDYAETKYNNFFDQAVAERQMPSWNRVVNLIRRTRSVNKVAIFRQIDSTGNWQR